MWMGRRVERLGLVSVVKQAVLHTLVASEPSV